MKKLLIGLCVSTLTACSHSSISYKSDTSKKTGKKSWKRLWCHVYENVHPIEPFTWLGSQGWSTLNDEQIGKIILLNA